MNERLKELIDQCINERLIEYDGGGEYVEVFDKEKFAELILNDIDGIIDSLYHLMPLEQAAVLLTLDEQIKAHFYGVEE
jgi:hypothetical protein